MLFKTGLGLGQDAQPGTLVYKGNNGEFNNKYEQARPSG